MAGVAIRLMCLPCSTEYFARKWSASSMMSGFRSRSGGAKIVKTFSR